MTPAVAPAEQVLTEFGCWPNSWLWPVTWGSVGACCAVAPAEQVLTEFRLTAKRRLLERVVRDGTVDS